MANGGVALGKSRFFEETGIKESDWIGRYWARWNDAIAEAGFSPNQMQDAFDDDHLLERYTSVVRALGHIPTNAELKLHIRNREGYPSPNTFARLGNKQTLLAKVLQFTQQHSAYDDVRKICESAGVTIKADLIESKPEVSEDDGFVYLIKSGKYYKIGRTNAIGRRERELAIQLPEKAQTIHSIRTDDPTGIEAYWHKRFQMKRKNGEWFDLSSQDVAAFRRRKFM